jgi:RNA polymerase sigma-70 factor, ECF subfamily
MREPLQWRDADRQTGHRQPDSWKPDFEMLVEEHQSMVFSLAWRMTGDRSLAEELAQDVLLELHRNLARMKSAGHVRFWLRQVAMHRSADALRRRRTNAATLGTDVWEELEERHVLAEPFDMDEDSPLGRRIEELLASLPESQRSALILRYQEDLSPEEIAVTLQAPLATVKSHLQRGLKLLRIKAGQRLKEYVRGT